MYKYTCGCRIKEGMTYEELRELLPGCMSRWLCRNLDKEFRRADKDRAYQNRRAKQLKQQGYTEEEIKEKGTRKRSKAASIVEIDLEGIGQ